MFSSSTSPFFLVSQSFPYCPFQSFLIIAVGFNMTNGLTQATLAAPADCPKIVTCKEFGSGKTSDDLGFMRFILQYHVVRKLGQKPWWATTSNLHVYIYNIIYIYCIIYIYITFYIYILCVYMIILRILL